MDNTCYKCGQPVAEGTAFCPHCGAPQIRVSVPEVASTPASPSLPPGTPAEIQPPAQPVRLSPTGKGIDWSVARTSAGMAGIFIGISTFLPLAFVLMILGGFAAVRIYNSRTPRRITTPADGAKVGAASGLAGYALFAVIMLLILRFWGESFWKWLLDLMRAQASATGRDIQPVLDLMNSGEGKAALAILLMAITFVMMLALSSLGGAIGAAFARRADHRH